MSYKMEGYCDYFMFPCCPISLEKCVLACVEDEKEGEDNANNPRVEKSLLKLNE